MNAASRYIAGLYESAVDRGLHLEAIRLELASRGIPRSAAQVRHDLDSVYCFHGYSDTHPPAEVIPASQWDAQIGR